MEYRDILIDVLRRLAALEAESVQWAPIRFGDDEVPFNPVHDSPELA